LLIQNKSKLHIEALENDSRTFDREISDFYLVKAFQKGQISMIFSKISKLLKFIKSENEIRREKNEIKDREGSCSTSYPSGNQVDGLPLVAIVSWKWD